MNKIKVNEEILIREQDTILTQNASEKSIHIRKASVENR